MSTRTYDVVCIGGGGAGVTAAVTAASSGAKVALVSKDLVGYGNTRISGGRMLLPGLADGDTPEKFLQDVLVKGSFMNRRDLAETFVNECYLAVPQSESFGALFQRDEAGTLNGSLEETEDGTFPRTVHMKYPSYGVPLGHALRAAVSRARIDILEETVVSKILISDGRVQGIACLRLANGRPFVMAAKAVVIATGGLGWLYYPHTHNMRPATGDGYGLALHAGAELIDMEQVQWRAFSLTHPKGFFGIGCNPTIGRVLNNKGEVVFETAALGSPGQVTTIALELEHGGGSPFGGLTVDFSQYYTDEGREILAKHAHQGPDDLIRLAYGEKAARREESWDVAPCVMYHCGGLKIDSDCRSSVDGLFAAGEAAGGLHGGSRLGDSALAAIFVFGRRAGVAAATYAKKRHDEFSAQDQARKEITRIRRIFGSDGSSRPVKLKSRLQSLMWETAGPVRTAKKLKDGLCEIEGIEQASGSLSVSGIRRYNLEALDAIELPLMLATAKAVVTSALRRKESRGSHIRLDFPEPDDKRWFKNVIVRQEDGKMIVRTENIPRTGKRGN